MHSSCASVMLLPREEPCRVVVAQRNVIASCLEVFRAMLDGPLRSLLWWKVPLPIEIIRLSLRSLPRQARLGLCGSLISPAQWSPRARAQKSPLRAGIITSLSVLQNSSYLVNNFLFFFA